MNKIKEAKLAAEKAVVWQALCNNAFNRSAAARELGTNSKQICRLIAFHKLPSPIQAQYAKSRNNFRASLRHHHQSQT